MVSIIALPLCSISKLSCHSVKKIKPLCEIPRLIFTQFTFYNKNSLDALKSSNHYKSRKVRQKFFPLIFFFLLSSQASESKKKIPSFRTKDLCFISIIFPCFFFFFLAILFLYPKIFLAVSSFLIFKKNTISEVCGIFLS